MVLMHILYQDFFNFIAHRLFSPGLSAAVLSSHGLSLLLFYYLHLLYLCGCHKSVQEVLFILLVIY